MGQALFGGTSYIEHRDLYRSRDVNREFTTGDSTQFNGVVERALGLIETAAIAGRVQAHELFPGELRRCGLTRPIGRVMLSTGQRSRSTQRASRRMRCGIVAAPGKVLVLPFLTVMCNVKRENKSQAQAQECLYLGLHLTALETLYEC